MKSTLFAIALMISGAAIAQTYPDATTADPLDTAAPADTMDTMAAKDTTLTADTAMTVPATATTGQVSEPSNADPEHDARGIAVMSDPAAVPAGFNGTPTAAMGGPLIDPGAKAAGGYPACTATVTDNCLQAYERGRSAD